MGKLQSHNAIDALLVEARGSMPLVEAAIKRALKDSKDGRIDINDVIAYIREELSQAACTLKK